MYIFIVVAEKVKKMFEVNVILVHAYENIKPIHVSFAWPNNCEWKMNFKVKLLRNSYTFKKKQYVNVYV